MASDRQDSPQYQIRCDQCGVVEFPSLGDTLHNESVAMYYAGFHDGVEHGENPQSQSIVEVKDVDE